MKAAFVGTGALTATTTVNAGAFDLDFLLPSAACNLGAETTAGGAFFVDANGNGACDPATDPLFAWVATGGPPGTCFATSLTPTSARCMLRYPGDTDALEAVKTICPAVGTCLDFCGPQNSGAGGFASVCTGGAGGSGGAGGASHGALIHGDGAACPQAVPVPASACTAGSARCTYQGGDFGASTTNDPVTCACSSAHWACVVTDADGNTTCPFEDPPTTACQSTLTCAYPRANTIASCHCTAGSGAGGAGGGSGAGGGPWLCSL